MPNEPSMEEILSSIKRIIADEDRGTTPRAPRRGPRIAATEADAPQANAAETEAQDADETAILELTDALPDEPASLEEPMSDPASAAGETKAAGKTQADPALARPAKAERRVETKAADTKPAKTTPASVVLSDSSAQAARDSLDALSKLLVRSEDGQSNTLEGLVREMLRPMLKEWLDAHLPELVETLVKREIDRIIGRV